MWVRTYGGVEAPPYKASNNSEAAGAEWWVSYVGPRCLVAIERSDGTNEGLLCYIGHSWRV